MVRTQTSTGPAPRVRAKGVKIAFPEPLRHVTSPCRGATSASARVAHPSSVARGSYELLGHGVHARLFFVVLVVITDQVQNAVRQQETDLVQQGPPAVARLPLRRI